MTLKTIFEVPTQADRMTQPGGIALRVRDDGEFIVHYFTTDRETGTERHYHQGSYFSAGSPANRFANAMVEFNRRIERSTGYDTGGALDIDKLTGMGLTALYA